MRQEHIFAVQVCTTDDGTEFYGVGFDGCSSVEWGEIPGPNGVLSTVRVFHEGVLTSEHPLSNVTGVYFSDRPIKVHTLQELWDSER